MCSDVFFTNVDAYKLMETACVIPYDIAFQSMYYDIIMVHFAVLKTS